MNIRERVKEWNKRNSLIRFFKPNKGELRDIDLLLFKGKLLADRLNPNRSFLQIPRHEWWNSVPSFSKQMLGPLLLAFSEWPIKACQKNGKYNVPMFEFFNQDSRMTVMTAESRLKLSFQTNDISELYKKLIKRFDVEVEDAPQIDNEENLSDAITAWTALMNEHTWKEVVPGQPKIAVLESPFKAHLLPLKIKVFDTERKTAITFHRLFSHFYIPDFYINEKKAGALFDYLAKTGRIAEISDYHFKEQVTKILLREVNRRIKRGERLSVLDVGCGDGFVGDVLENTGLRSNIILDGVDVSNEMLSKLQGKGSYDGLKQISITKASRRKLLKSFDSKGFDSTILAFVDLYLSDYGKVVAYRTIHNSLTEGGCLAFDVHHPDRIWKYIYKNILKKAGFSLFEFVEEDIQAKDGVRKVGIVFAFK